MVHKITFYSKAENEYKKENNSKSEIKSQAKHVNEDGRCIQILPYSHCSQIHTKSYLIAADIVGNFSNLIFRHWQFF